MKRRSGDFNGKRILILEDDELIGRLLQAIIINGGYEVVVFLTVKDALQYLNESQQKIDLIITDLLLPMVGGFDFIEKLKKFNEPKQFMVVTSMRDKNTRDKVNAAGAVDFILKPFKSSDVLERLDQFFKNSGATSKQIS